MYAHKANIIKGLDKSLWLLLTSILFFLSGNTLAQAQSQSLSLKFERFSDEYSHPKSPVNGNIIQDEDGFIWFGSWNGLFKYDGYTFTGYYHDPNDSTSISADWSFPYIDSNGTFWVGTGAGLDRFDPVTEEFTRFQHDKNDPSSIGGGQVTALYMDSKKRLWVGTEQGLSRMDTQTETFVRFNHNPYYESTLTGNQIRVIYEDLDGNIWVGAGNPFSYQMPGGLNLYDEDSSSFQRYYIDPSDPMSSRNYIQSIFQNTDGRLWVAGWNAGLYHFDTNTESFDPIPYPEYPTENIRGNFHGITHMYHQKDSDNLWISTYGGGLHRYSLTDNSFASLQHDAVNSNTLSDNRLWVSFIDKNDVLWAGTHVGLNKANLPGMFPQFTLDLQESEGVTEIVQDEKGLFWLGTSAMRLISWNPDTNRFQTYLPPERPCAGWSVPGSAILQDTGETFWFLNQCGLYEFDREAGRFSRLNHQINNSSIIRSDQPIRIVQSAPDELILSSEPISVINLQDGTFEQYGHDPENPTSLNADDVDAIYKDSDGTVWIGTTNGLARYNREDSSFERMIVIEDAQKTAITDLTMGADGDIYAASDTYGMIRLDPESGNFETFTIQKGLQTNTNYGIIQDPSGTVWVLSPVGLTRLNLDTGMPDFFDQSDGLVETTFSERSMLLSGDGELIIGGVGALNKFDPDVWFGRSQTPGVVLLNTSVTDGYQTSTVLTDTRASESSVNTSGVRLNYRQNNLSFEYAGIDHRDPSKVRYQYMLENFDDGWISAGTQRVARYSRLPAGTYTFKVRAAGIAGLWSETAVSAPITIRSPWWRTNWAYAGYFLIFFSLLLGFWKYEMNRINLRNRLELESLETEKIRELDQLKSRFFANISHEFRTPITLILGQIRSVLPGTTDPGARKKMHNAFQNASRLNELVNQLLDLSRLEFGKMKLKFVRQNAVPLISKIGNSFETLAEDRQISLQIITPDVQITLDHDPDKLEKILTNLVSNAIKFTAEGGSVRVEARLSPLPKISASGNTSNQSNAVTSDSENNEGVLIRVSDNGIGIPEKHIPHIFDRFFQVDDSDTRLFEGSGIGLALTKQLVDLHKGEIWVESTVNEGSTFYVWLPLMQREHVPTSQTAPPADAHPESLQVIVKPTNEPEPELAEEEMTISGGNVPENEELVLIVEDNEDMRDYLCSYLKQWYNIITEPNGEAGYKRAVSAIPDLIVCDVMMPKMNGLEFMQHLRKDEKTSHIPVIMLTARADDEHKLSGIESGVDAYLTKPFNDKELKLRIDKLIAMRKSLRKQFSDQLVIRPKDVKATSLDQEFLERVINAIEENIDNETYSVEALAADVNMSQAQLNRKINALISQPPGKLLRSMRLQRAADLLEKGAGNVAEICYQTGFSSQAAFSRSFKKQFGVSPSNYAHSSAGKVKSDS